MVIFMSDPQTGAWTGKHLDFEAFPENLELARNIQERLPKSMDTYRGAGLRPLDVLKNVLAAEQYITQLYADIKYNAAASSRGLCVGVATEVFLISLACAPRFYRQPEDLEKHPVDKDIVTFVKKMGDSISMNEIDLDLGSSRWTVSADLLMDMLSSLNVVSASIIMGAENMEGENPATEVDVEYNVITGCTLVAAYGLVLYECIKNGSYKGQVLADIKR